jgi:MerR family mercuric resistance operon transcriptional regulator
VVISNLSNPGGSASAAASRVPIEALRFYDRARLLPAETQGPGVAGTVAPHLERRLRFINGARELGFSLAEIRELLALSDHGLSDEDQSPSRIDRLVGQLDDKLVELMRLRKALLRVREDVPKPTALHGGSILAVFGGGPDE